MTIGSRPSVKMHVLATTSINTAAFFLIWRWVVARKHDARQREQVLDCWVWHVVTFALCMPLAIVIGAIVMVHLPFGEASQLQFTYEVFMIFGTGFSPYIMLQIAMLASMRRAAKKDAPWHYPKIAPRFEHWLKSLIAR